jgi:hypothetical protein
MTVHPAERIRHVFERLESQAATPEFRGCRYLAIQIELKDQRHPASRVARRVKANLTKFFRTEAEQGGSSSLLSNSWYMERFDTPAALHNASMPMPSG